MAQTPSDNQRLMREIEIKRKDKAAGAFIGLLVGDALGAAVEFKKRDTFKGEAEVHMALRQDTGLMTAQWLSVLLKA
jgi:ADP-ribosyl-[dinitrogen reductase] hydrolase